MVDYTFGVSDGTRLNNLHDLARALEFMSESTYNSHVSNGKNDFSEWVKEVLGIDSLAAQLNNSKNQYDAEIIVLEHILKIARQMANRGHD